MYFQDFYWKEREEGGGREEEGTRGRGEGEEEGKKKGEGMGKRREREEEKKKLDCVCMHTLFLVPPIPCSFSMDREVYNHSNDTGSHFVIMRGASLKLKLIM